MSKDRHWRTPFRTRSGIVWGSSFDHPDAGQRLLTDPPPDVGIYLDAAWRKRPARRKHVIDWPDLGVPEDPTALLRALGAR